MKTKGLGRDFWLYRGGQMVSVIGDSCGSIAMAWWILNATGSAAKMSYIMAPMIFMNVVLLPLLGPLGDRFERKKLIIWADLWRGALYTALAAMALFHYFNLWALVTLYMLVGAGGALFEAGSSAIIPSIVDKEHIPAAMQRNEAVHSGGRVIGGAVGGILVSLLGVGGALLVDALSFFAATVGSAMIKADTRPAAAPNDGSLAAWAAQLKDGVRAMSRVPTLLWLGFFAAFINFAFSPINVGLPVLAKQVRNMPPWFMGALQSSLSGGVVLGSLWVGGITRRLRGDRAVVGAAVALGLSMAVLPYAPTAALPVFVMFCLGLMMALVNIPLNTRQTMATPNHYRARMGTAIGFMCGAISPLGMAISGWSMTRYGLPVTFLCGGLGVAGFSLLLLLIPGFKEMMTVADGEAHGYFARRYPEAFLEAPAASRSALP